ncbi:MAG: hypothetical protein WAL34_04275 [Acidobacteriaceae bacterium]
MRPSANRVVITFDDFRLVLRPNPNGRHSSDLSRISTGGVIELQPLTMEVLEFFVYLNEYGDKFHFSEIYEPIWGASSPDPSLVEAQFDKLRKRICSTVVKSLGHGHYQFGFKFIRRGNLCALSGVSHWDPTRLGQILNSTEAPLDSGESTDRIGDVRVVTTRILWGRDDSPMGQYLASGLRFRVVLIDFTNTELMKARFGFYKATAEEMVKDIQKQVTHFKDLQRQHGSNAIQWRFTNSITLGPLFHTKQWAVLGTFPAQAPYIIGPMMIVSKTLDRRLWAILFKEWRIRWDNPSPSPELNEWRCKEPEPKRAQPPSHVKVAASGF